MRCGAALPRRGPLARASQIILLAFEAVGFGDRLHHKLALRIGGFLLRRRHRISFPPSLQRGGETMERLRVISWALALVVLWPMPGIAQCYVYFPHSIILDVEFRTTWTAACSVSGWEKSCLPLCSYFRVDM